MTSTISKSQPASEKKQQKNKLKLQFCLYLAKIYFFKISVITPEIQSFLLFHCADFKLVNAGAYV